MIKSNGKTNILGCGLSLFCTLAVGYPASVDEERWQEQIQKATVLQQQGSYAEAEPILLSVARTAKALGLRNADLAQVLNRIGGLYVELGRYGEAERYLRRSLALQPNETEGHSPDPFQAANNLVSLYIEMGQFSRAEKLAKQVLSRTEPTLQIYPHDRAQALHNLAAIYYFQSRYPQAESLLRQALNLLEKHKGDEGTEMMYILFSMGSVLVRTTQPGEALASIERARRIGENLTKNDHVVLCRALITESSIYRSMNRVAEAEAAVGKALTILLDSKLKPLLQAAWEEYAHVLQQSGRRTNAKQAKARAREIRDELQRDNPARHTVDINALTSALN
jgi:tetratricopeptide (TPR) repeat protein